MAWELVCVCVCGWVMISDMCLVVGYNPTSLCVRSFFFFKGTNHNHASLLSIFLLSSKHHNIGCYFFLTPLSSFRILYNLPHQTPVVSLKFGFYLFFKGHFLILILGRVLILFDIITINFPVLGEHVFVVSSPFSIRKH